jgi:hypothetical protein
MSNNPDLNLSNYTVSDMMGILGLDNLDDKDEIYNKTDYYISLSKSKNNKPMEDFFMQMQTQLLYAASTSQQELQTEKWYQEEALKQNDPLQNLKITDREQKIDVYNNTHLPMNREQLGIVNSYNVPIVQDTLNPNLKNVYNRFISLDSQYRQSSNPDSPSEYVADLSDVLTNVLSLRLYSVQIPYSWYNFDKYYYNDVFWIEVYTTSDLSTKEIITITITSGYYNAVTLQDEINTQITNSGIVGVVISYSFITAKMTFTVGDGSGGGVVTYQGNPVYGVNILFFNIDLWYCSTDGSSPSFNQTLGWSLGFRNVEYLSVTKITGMASVDIQGPRYLVLCIDDYNQNHINNGLVSITQTSRYIRPPSYLPPCAAILRKDLNTVSTKDAAVLTEETGGNIMEIVDKLGTSFVNTPYYGITPDGAQYLTQSQMYTVNEILKNNKNINLYESVAPTMPDVFAVLPIKPGSFGSTYVEFGGTVQDNRRVYFGPVNIERLKVKLYTDRGALLNLNGLNWSITIIAELLYQY